MSRYIGLLGIALIIGVGVLLSSNRRAIRWSVIAWGLGLQVAFALFVLRVPAGQELFRTLGAAVTALLHFSYAGSEFVFGEIGKPNSSLGRRLRVPGAAGDHLRLGALRDPVSHRRHGRDRPRPSRSS